MGIRETTSTLLGHAVAGATRLQGGRLSTLYRLTLADGTPLIAKTGPRVAAEGRMLAALRAAGAPAPAVLACEGEVLIMEWIAASGFSGAAWGDLARVLAGLHGMYGPAYGWGEDYAFGEVAIPNGKRPDWPAFWAEQRLLCHADHVPAPMARRIEHLATALPGRLPATPPPALLHGDLWGGNILVADAMVAGLIDPACAYGHREVDVAMLTLFDHPPPRFFAALDLEAGWRERLPAYQLWPWLVHYRLFGETYRGMVEACLDRLCV